MPGVEQPRNRLDTVWLIFTIGLSLLLVYAISVNLHVFRPTAPTENAPETGWALHLLLDLCRDLGISFVVGGTVSIGIERISRERFQREITSEINKIERSFFNAAFLKRYPDAFPKMFKDTLFDAKLVRLDLNVEVFIQLPEDAKPVDDSDSSVHVDQIVSYALRNISDEGQVYQPTISLEKDWDQRLPDLLSWKAGSVQLSAIQIESADEQASDSPLQKRYKFPNEINIPPGAEIRIASKVRTYKRARDATTWCGVMASDGLKFRITHPPGFQVYLQAKTPARESDGPVASDGRRVVLEIFTPVLPYTTVEYGWRANAPPAEQSYGDTVGVRLP